MKKKVAKRVRTAAAELAPELTAMVAPVAPSKGQRRRLEMVQAVVRIVAEDGIDSLTFDRVAKDCGVSRPLVFHYYPDRDALLTAAFTLVRAEYQRRGIAALKRESSPEGRMRSFLEFNFDWVDECPTHARLWALFLCYCGTNATFRALNTDLALIGVRRVAAIIEAGLVTGRFHTNAPEAAAKQIQSAIVGALFTLVTEDHGRQAKSFQRRFITGVLALADASY